MKNVYLSKEARVIIEKNMPAKVRKLYKKGEEVIIKIERIAIKPMKRWWKNEECELKITKNGKIIENNMIPWTWTRDTEKEPFEAFEAANAVDYMIYGEKNKDWVMTFIA